VSDTERDSGWSEQYAETGGWPPPAEDQRSYGPGTPPADPSDAAQPFVYRGFRMVDEQRFRDLHGDQLRKINQNGILPLIIAHLFSLSLIRDTRSDSLEPNAGALVGLDGEVAPRALGSEVGFVKSFVQGFTYRRLGKSRVVGAFGARLGLGVSAGHRRGGRAVPPVGGQPRSAGCARGFGVATVRGVQRPSRHLPRRALPHFRVASNQRPALRIQRWR